ncbi:MAG: DUF1902 domain-containing protein [Clostridia bacterium]|nr:DUF1902 domain-containing protein [Clostridia bacterium]
MDYTVNLSWDNEADVWVAQSDDIPGLILESGSFDALIERVRFAIPELIELNKAENPFTLDTKIKSRHTANAIMKQSGIDFKF